MNYSIIFNISNIIVILAWMLLLFFPKSSLTKKNVLSGRVSIILSFIYCMLAIYAICNKVPGGFSSFDKVYLVFESKVWVLAVWVHFLAFDLLIGAHISKKSRDIGLCRPLEAISLILTMLFGPAGFLFFKLFSKPNKE